MGPSKKTPTKPRKAAAAGGDSSAPAAADSAALGHGSPVVVAQPATTAGAASPVAPTVTPALMPAVGTQATPVLIASSSASSSSVPLPQATSTNSPGGAPASVVLLSSSPAASSNHHLARSPAPIVGPPVVYAFGLPEKLWMSIMGDYFPVSALFRFRILNKQIAHMVRARLLNPEARMYFDSNVAVSHALKISPSPKFIHVQGTRVSDTGLASIFHSSSRITHFIVRGCDNVTDESLKALGPKSGSLQRLVIDRRPLLALARNAYASSKGSTVVTDAGMRALLTHARALQEISLNWCHGVTDESFDEFHLRCPEMSLLSLGWIQITDKACAFFSLLTRLTVLDMRTLHNVTDVGVGTILERCTQLKRVTLLDVGVLDHSLTKLAAGSAANLVELHLSDLDSITDVGLNALAAKVSVSLELLNLSHLPGITDSGVSTLLAACMGLKKLELNWLAQITDSSLAVLADAKYWRLSTVLIDGLKSITHTPISALLKTLPSLVRVEAYGSSISAPATQELRREARPGVTLKTQAW